MPARYVEDHIGTGQLLRSPEMMNMVYDFAAEGARFARDISPRGETGEYRESFKVTGGLIGPLVTKYGTSYRAIARLSNDSGHALAVEYMWGHHILGRTIDRIQRVKFG